MNTADVFQCAVCGRGAYHLPRMVLLNPVELEPGQILAAGRHYMHKLCAAEVGARSAKSVVESYLGRRSKRGTGD